VKSEAWVVIDADRDAVIYKGLKPNVTREAFAQHIRTNEVVNDLNVVVARPGDCHYLPSGTVHALGAGIVVAEVQTPSDTTFRVYDWGRNEPGRPLHIEQALECIDFSGRPPPSPRLGLPNSRDGLTTTPLTATEHFEIERCDAEAGSSFELITQNLPQVWMMLGGSGRIETSGGKRAAVVDLAAGTTVLIPAAAQSWTARFNASSRLLCVRLPSPLRNMLASS
jgi:mannose-6-phosphate isomerase